MESIGLYIHIPFCRQKCLYCDFPSWAGREGQMQMYVDALTAEIRAQGKRYENREVVSVFFGGGTPTYLGNKRLSSLLYTLSLSMHLTPEVECTIEANPDSLSESMVKDMFDGKITVSNDVSKAPSDFATVIAVEDQGAIKG